MADDETGARLHASFDVVVELVLPCVDLGWADVEAGFRLATIALVGIDDDERVGVFGEVDEHKSLVKCHVLFIGHC